MTAEETGRWLGVRKAQVYQLVRDGVLPCVKLGRAVRFDPVELEEALDRTRWKLAEELVGQDPFEFEKVLAYGIQLKITERWNRMDVSAGKKSIEAVITANTEKGETTKA